MLIFCLVKLTSEGTVAVRTAPAPCDAYRRSVERALSSRDALGPTGSEDSKAETRKKLPTVQVRQRPQPML